MRWMELHNIIFAIKDERQRQQERYIEAMCEFESVSRYSLSHNPLESVVEDVRLNGGL